MRQVMRLKITLLIIYRMTDQPDLLFLLHDLARHLRLTADRRAACHGLTRAQWVILFRLDHQPGLSQKELAELLEVEPITVARLIDRLEEHGMVERRSDPGDRRVWRLHLRAPAPPVLEALDEERAAMLANATLGLEPETIAIVADALGRMKQRDNRVARPRAPAGSAGNRLMSEATIDDLGAAQRVGAETGRPGVNRARAGLRVLRRLLMLGGIAVAVAGAGAFWLTGGRVVSVDNAYVRAGKLSVATDVSGIVQEVAVKEGAHVRRGDVLFRLDPRPFEIALDGAEASRAQWRCKWKRPSATTSACGATSRPSRPRCSPTRPATSATPIW